MRYFKGRSADVQVLVDWARLLIASWVSVLPQFRGFFYDFILFNWKEMALEAGVCLGV